MNFLIQIDNKGKIEHDFVEILVKIKEFYDQWYSSARIIDIDFCSIDNLEQYCKNKEDIVEWTPVGGVDFVQKFARYGLQVDDFPVPLNVPEELMSELYSGRICRNIRSCKDAEKYLDYVEMHNHNKSKSRRFFVKSIEFIKDDDNGFYDVIPDNKDGYMTMEGRLQNGCSVSKIFRNNAPARFLNCQVSTLLPDILSEWRIFVHGGQGVDIKNYAGDPFKFPNVDRIKEFIEQFKSAPENYTLDVAVTTNGTWVLECHDFFSCGNYGFNDYRLYPLMLDRAWFNIKNKLLNTKTNS